MVTDAISELWVQALVGWFRDNEHVTAAYLYGSRVKGGHRSDSDLDVAVRLGGMGEDPLTTWTCEAEEWRSQLAQLVPVAVHLELAQDDDDTVFPAVNEHGIQIFQRE